MVIADGAWVAVFDPKSNRNPTRYTLDRTPLSLLLRDRLSLAEPGMVQGATRDAAGTDITVVDPRTPKEGRMVMSFSDAADPAPPVGDHHQDRPDHPRGPDRPHDRRLARPQPLQHRARHRELPLSLRPPRRPVFRRVEVDERRPSRRRHLGDELRRLAQHLPRPAVALQPRQRLEEPPPEQHRMPGRAVAR